MKLSPLACCLPLVTPVVAADLMIRPLEAETPSSGVVFEIMPWKDSLWGRVEPLLRAYVDRPRDFLGFVYVTGSGSALQADYVSLGFARIKLEPAHATD